jgi:hypothetical protein
MSGYGWVRRQAVLVLVAVLVGAMPAAASHFLFGNLSWEPRADVAANAVEFHLGSGFRRDAFVGSAGDGFPQTGDYVQEFVGVPILCFGDASCTDTLFFRVTAFDTTFNWILGEAVGINTLAGSGNSIPESEPNGTVGTADPISLGDDMTGAISVADEVDLFSFSMTAGTLGVARLTLGTLAAGTLEVYDPNLDFIAFGGPGEDVPFFAHSTGTYLVQIHDVAGDSTGTYTARVRAASEADLVHTYAAPGDYLAFSETSSRLEPCNDAPNTLLNNANGSYRLESDVTAGSGNSAPTSSLPPIVTCSGPCSFTIPAGDGEGDTLAYRLSTDAEAAGDPFVQPGEAGANNCANALSIDSSSGLVTWDPTGCDTAAVCGDVAFTNTLYSAQVMVEDGQTKAPVDFLLLLLPASANNPPAFTSAVCGTTVDAVVGAPVQFAVSAQDGDGGDSVDLNVAGLPAGATMTPPLPLNGNPASSTFDWTPGPGDVGVTPLTFTATDESQEQALCAVNVEVALGEVLATVEIPTLGRFGVVALGVALAAAGALLVRRPRRSRSG